MRGASQDTATPYCRCRVLYLGSSVPHTSKEGLLGIQEPLRELYPEQGALGTRGIDSWLSVWSNGLLLENMDENRKKVTRFFPIEALHYCAAVRHVKGGSGEASATRFLPLDSPFARTPSANHPPLFAAVLRRTTGIKVLECHAFICKRDMAANALVRCCFHAYADSSYAKGLDPATTATTATMTTNGHGTNHSNGSLYHTLGGSSTTLNRYVDGAMTGADDASIYNGNENHKVWMRARDEIDGIYQSQGTIRSTKGSRPRQLVAPPSPPPPPPPPPAQPLLLEECASSKSKKAGKKLKKLKSRSLNEELIQQQQQHHAGLHPMQAIYANGHHTLGHHPVRQQHFPPHPASRSIAGTLARPGPVLLVPATTLPRKSHQRGIRPMPGSAPIVPVYAPIPVVPPPPPPPSAMYPGAYGTAGMRGRRHHHPDLEPATIASASRRLAASHADLTAPEVARRSQDSPDNDSRFGTGIYRRKGHLNERAFSYSIRAEHRSRSHGSLSSLGFNGQNGMSLPKEENLNQLVAGLSLDGSPERRENNHSRIINSHYHQQPQAKPRPR